MTNRLAQTEMKILSKLDTGARESFRSIGRRIRKSEQNVSYSVNSLIKKGVIKNFYTLVDYSRLSVLNFRVFFKINYINQTKFNEMIGSLVKHPNTMWVAACGGRYDLLCTFGARNPSQFNKLLKSIMAEFPRQMRSYDILTTTVIRMLPRKYLSVQRGETKSVIVGGDREPYDLQKKDTQLLAEIAGEARKSSVEIGNKIFLNPRTVINRIRVLKEMGVIRGFRTFIDFSETTYEAKLLLIRYHNISVEDEESLVEHLCLHPKVSCVTKTIGRWDLEIRVEGEDYRDFMRIEREIREKFSEMIQRTETVPLYNEFKKTFFPRFLVEK